jgi:exodeoxyribonuclease VII large subunit
MDLTTEATTSALSIFDLSQKIKSLLESGIGVVWVRGEISNFKPHSSGHFYFSLKDNHAQIKAVMFRGYNSRLKFKPADGLEVLARGQISSYPQRGEYQIYIEHMEPLGAGALQRAFEALKAKLFAEGLFDPSRKKPLPKRPRGIAVVTSETGAAIQDILNILKRRCKSIPVILVPTAVQGAQAATQIIAALENAYQLKNIDVIILGRGGGSIEDMWCFNDEALARTIAKSPIPIISAVGHEIDFTISDFVADLRAPTPSAAAELVAQSDTDLIFQFQNLSQQIGFLTSKQIKLYYERTIQLRARIVDPKKRLRDLILRQDELTERLRLSFSSLLKNKLSSLSLLTQKILGFTNYFPTRFERLLRLDEKLRDMIRNSIVISRIKFSNKVALLDSLNPLGVLKRGYAFQMDSNQKIFYSVSDVVVGSQMISVLKDGRIYSQVSRVEFIDITKEL